MTVELFGVDDAVRMRRALALRIAVFVVEQGVPEEEEIDDHDRTDPTAVHGLVNDEHGPLSTGRFYDAGDGTAQIGRMAVRREARGLGAGKAVLDALVAEARRRGYKRAVLNAQEHAIKFYERAGFAVSGDRYDECGIPHRPMAVPF